MKSIFLFPTVFLELNSPLSVRDDQMLSEVLHCSAFSDVLCSVATAHAGDELCPADLQELNRLFS